MRVRTKSLELIAPATEIFFDDQSFGYRFDGDYGNIQVVAKGMDGGTFSVYLLGPGEDEIYRPVATAKTVNDIVIIPDGYVCQIVKITFAALGIGAAPIVTLSMSGRTVRASG